MKLTFLLLAALLVCAASSDAQTMSYGTPITADAAKKVAAPAIAEARKNNWAMAIAIVDIAGELVYFEKMDDTQAGSTVEHLGTRTSYSYQLEAFAEHVLRGAPLPLNLADSVENMAYIDAGYRAAGMDPR